MPEGYEGEEMGEAPAKRNDPGSELQQEGLTRERGEGYPCTTLEAPMKDDPEETETTEAGVSRRGFLRGLAATAITSGLSAVETSAAPEPQATPAGAPSVKGTAAVTLTVNGNKRTATVDTRRTLLDMLRNDFDLTGAKKVCDHGSCGACTVIKDGRTVYACMTLALDCEGAKVETIEGLEKNGTLHPVQQAFIEKDALMCGFCTPGFLMSCKALLDHNPDPTADQVKRGCAGNICRCGTYPNIVDAVLAAAKKGGK